MRKILAIISLLFPVMVWALGPSPNFRHYSTSEGLPSNCIRDIIQDSTGFIWFATDGGLVRYDGREFKVYMPSDIAGWSKEDNYVSHLVESGRYIWVGTDKGVIRYDCGMERLEDPELVFEKGDKSLMRDHVRSLCADKDGNIWVGTASKGVFRIDKDLNAKYYNVPAIANIVGCIYVDNQGEIWLTGSRGYDGLYRYNTNADTFERVNVFVDGRQYPVKSMAIVEDTSNRLWIGLWDNGLLLYDPVDCEAEIVCDRDDELGERMFHIHSLENGSDGKLLIGADRGLFVYDKNNGSVRLYDNDELRPTSLSGRFVYPIMTDDEGGLWIGTFYAGVNYLCPNINKFESSRHSRFVNSVGGNIISCFCEDESGNIYIGSDDGGLCRFNTATDRYDHIPLGGMSYENVHALCMDGSDLWIGTYAGGVKVYDTKTGRIKHDFMREGNGGADVSSSYAIYKDSRGNMWIASMDAIYVLNRDKYSLEEVRKSGATIADIDEDMNGNLWFSTQGRGLLKFSPRQKIWKSYRMADKPGSMINNHISGINIDDKGSIWIATSNGLAKYRPETDDFEEVNLDMPNKMLTLVESCGEELWIGTTTGLLRYHPEEGSTIYTTTDGLVDNQLGVNASYKASDGKIYVGTVGGYTSFIPSVVRKSRVSPRLIFTGLDLGGKHIAVGDSHLPKSLNEIERLELGPDDYMFSISFAALNFTNASGGSYLYCLEGFDKDWMESSGDYRATYTNIPPGDYTMRVVAADDRDNAHIAGISLPIHIAPPWFESWPMKTAYVILVIGLISMITFFAMQRNDRRHKAELERVNASKEMEVYEAKVNFFTTVAHEIRTPVSLIIGPLENIMHSGHDFSRQESEDIDIIYRNSQRLLFLVNQLLDFKKVEQLALSARFSRHNIPDLVRITAKRFRPSIQHKGAELVVDIPDNPFYADVDVEALTKLISNLLNNARRFTTSKVTVSCREEKEKDTFILEIGDNGIGISEEDQKKIFKPFVQITDENGYSNEGTGLGLSIVKKVVKAHSGKISVRSVLGEGTVFTVEFPLHQQAFDEEVAGEATREEVVPEDDIEVIEERTDDDKPVMLVVDDNNDLLRFMSNNFSDGYHVIAVSSGEEALERLSCQTVDIIVSDWMMPGMSGVELCSKVRAGVSTSHIPFVILTAKTDNYSKIEGMNCGADAFVEKPFSVGYLKARLRQLGDMRQLLRHKFSSTPLEPIETLAATPLDSDFLKRLTEVIEENFSNPELSVDFLARTLGVSRSGLYSKIKTLANITPNELIQITRLKRAAQLLAENKYRVSEICYMVGFNSPSYFAKCFQKQFGMKPGEFTPNTRE